eukprot:4541259-Ditylum_brightwellii.AAC.1
MEEQDGRTEGLKGFIWGAKEKIKVKKGENRKNKGRKPPSVTSSQGRRTAVKKKKMKAKMGDK